ncbi:MAG: response regulator, partial [Eubacteriales bacterium]|nr:response regulator [Eubacteriales bacterium]
MDGYELVRAIRELPACKHMPVIAITESDAASKQKAMEAGADEFITKPFITAELHNRINHACNKPLLYDRIDFDNIFSAISGGVAIYEYHGGAFLLQSCTPGVAAFSGRTVEEYRVLLNERHESVVYPEDEPRVMGALRRSVETGEEVDLIHRVSHKRGYPVWVRLRGHVVRQENGAKQLHAVFLDASKDTQLYRDILDEANVIVQVCDVHTCELLYANHTACRFAGKPAGSYVGQTCHSFLMGSEQCCGFCQRRLLQRDELKGYEQQRGGRYYRVSGKLLDWAGREAFVEYVEDITEEKLVALASEHQRAELQRIIDNLLTGVGVFQRRGEQITVRALNQTALVLANLPAVDALHQPMDTLWGQVHPEDLPLVRDFSRQLHIGSRVSSVVYRHRCAPAGDYRWMFSLGKCVEQPDGSELSYVTFTDVSHQKLLEAQLTEREASLRAAVSHTNLYYWEWDLKTDIATFGQKHQEDFPLGASLEHYPESWLSAGYVHPDDVEAYRRNAALVKNGQPYIEWECRCLDCKTGRYPWRRIYFTLIESGDGQRRKAVATARDIHSLKEMEQNFVQTIAQNGIWACSLDLRTRQIHRIGLDDFHQAEGDVIENVPESLIAAGRYHPDSVEQVRRVYGELYAGAKRASAEVRLRTGEAQDFHWFALTLTAVDDGVGSPVRAICTSRDITEEKHMEQLYHDEQVFRRDLGDKLLGSCQLNLSVNAVESLYVGDRSLLTDDVRGLTDYRRRVQLFLDDLDLNDEDAAQLCPEQLMEAYRQGRQSVSLSYMVKRRSDQQPLWIEVNCHILRRPETGDIVAFFYHSDATDRYVANQLNETIMSWDYDYAALIFTSNGRMRMLSKSQADSSAPRLSECDYADYAALETRRRAPAGGYLPLPLTEVLERLKSEDSFTVEADRLEESGETRKKRWKFIYKDRKHGILSLTCIDIEDIVREERKKQKQLIAAVNAAEKANAAKSEFLARMSHEFRTPLNGVVGLAALAREENDPETLRDYIEKIDVSGKHLKNLVNDILDMSKIESGEIELHPEVFLFDDFIGGINAVIQPLCRQKNIRFITDMASYHVPIFVDKTRFNQILFNLLSNAVKFTPEGGEVRLTYRNRRNVDKLYLDMAVQDNGVGMSEEFQKHMFDPFTQESSDVSAATQGTGLGLSIAKAYAELMGGTLEVDSALGRGSTFHLRMDVPIAEQAGVRVRTLPKTVDFSGRTMLVAEDHPLNQLIVGRLLEKRNARMISVDDGRKAVERFAQSPVGGFAAILLDIRMPIMNGLEAAVAIRQMDRPDAKTVPILAMTANAYDEDRRKSTEAGINVHLAKPIDPETLYHTLAELIDEDEHRED